MDSLHCCRHKADVKGYSGNVLRREARNDEFCSRSLCSGHLQRIIYHVPDLHVKYESHVTQSKIIQIMIKSGDNGRYVWQNVKFR